MVSGEQGDGISTIKKKKGDGSQNPKNREMGLRTPRTRGQK